MSNQYDPSSKYFCWQDVTIPCLRQKLNVPHLYTVKYKHPLPVSFQIGFSIRPTSFQTCLSTRLVSFQREAIKPGTERNGTEPEVIDAQYRHGRRIRDVLICQLIKVQRAHFASCTSHEDKTTPIRQYRATPSVLNNLAVYLVT